MIAADRLRPLVEALHRRGFAPDAVAERMTRVLAHAGALRGVVIETPVDGDLALDLSLRYAPAALPTLPEPARTDAALFRDAALLRDAWRLWLEWDTSTGDGGPSLFAQLATPNAGVRLLDRLGWDAHPPVVDAPVRHLGRMYGRPSADVRVVWDAVPMAAITSVATRLEADLAPLGAWARRPEGLALGLAFAPTLQQRFGVEWAIRRARDPAAQWAALARAGLIGPAGRELGWWWLNLRSELPAVPGTGLSHVKWTFDGPTFAFKAYLAAG